MHQTIIYEFLGIEHDPIFKLVDSLKMGDSVKFNQVTISLNQFGIYEVISHKKHDGFDKKHKCYEHLINNYFSEQ